jgi:putative hydrolase of the HAD superfamily
MFDFGGVITTSPFDWFSRYEHEHGLPSGCIRQLNAQNADANAWSRLERNEIDFDHFCLEFEAEARAAGFTLDARAAMAGLRGSLRPEMVDVVRACSIRFKTACLTNNFYAGDTSRPSGFKDVLALFDLVLQSRELGIRKPDPGFYLTACERLGVTPDEVVYLDDLGVNLKPARQLGMITIKVGDPITAIAELRAVIGDEAGA